MRLLALSFGVRCH